MKSGVCYLEVAEASAWISAELEKEGRAIAEGLVLRILNRETQFLVMAGLARLGDENSAQSAHILRELCWVLDPSAQVEADQEIEPEEEVR